MWTAYDLAALSKAVAAIQRADRTLGQRLRSDMNLAPVVIRMADEPVAKAYPEFGTAEEPVWALSFQVDDDCP